MHSEHSDVNIEQFKEPHQMDGALWTRGRNAIVLIGVLAWAASLYGYFTNGDQFHASYLVGYLYYLSIGWGAMFFVMVQHVTGAAWSVTVRRLMENMMVTVPVLALLFIPVFMGIPNLYEWSKEGAINAANPNLQFKAVFFSQPFYMIRSVLYFAVWIVLALVLYKNSVAQDKGGDLEAFRRTQWWSAPGLVVLMVTVTMAAVDWVMSLDHHWYSTIFGVYVFSGGGLALMAAVTKAALFLRSQGVLKKSIHLEHYHDLGKWLFALTVWWAYIAFSQYMLIWYADIPEETLFFKHRLEGTWTWVSTALLVGHFIIPFLLLISRGAKRTLPVLWFASIWILAVHFIDLHWLVMPTVHPHGFHIHWMDFATLLAVGSVFAYVFWSRLKRNAMIPTGDLRLAEALSHHNV